jgi:hypothetical protein
MNDQQLIVALRALDRPFAPEPEFADALFDQLRRQALPGGRRPVQRNLLLVAALLGLAAIGTALAVGSRLLEDRQLLVEATPLATVRPYVVNVPPGVVPASAPETLEAVVRSLEAGAFGLQASVERVIELRWLPADTEVPTSDGGAFAATAPFWAITVATVEGPAVLFLGDGSAAVIGSDLPSDPSEPEPTLAVLPTRDPAIAIQLLGPGVAIEPMLVPFPGAEDRPSIGPLVEVDDVLWALASPVYTDGPARLVRVDAVSNTVSVQELPEVGFGSLAAGHGRLWLSSGSELLGLDATTGAIVDRFTVDGSVVGESADGVWLRSVGGAIVLDPATGTQLRQVSSPEGEGQAYRGIWQPPAFGSLWDVDRNTGLLHRIDPVTGATTVTIDLGIELAGSCGSDFGLVRDVPALGDLVGGACADGLVLIDPATNRVVERLPGSGVSAAGGWWSLRSPDPSSPSWDEPGELLRSEPGGGTGATMTLSLERHGGHLLAVAGDALWLLVAERADQGQDYEHNAALLRIPLVDLPG